MGEASKNSLTMTLEAITNHKNIIVFRNDTDCSIVEILSSKDKDFGRDNETVRVIEAFCVHVEPRACSRVVKQLSSTLPLEDCLSHLKRVRRRQPLPSTTSVGVKSNSATTAMDSKEPKEIKVTFGAKNNDTSMPLETGPKTSLEKVTPKKHNKPKFVLEVLIGTYSRLHSKNEPLAKDHPVIREFGPLHSVMVPKFEPRSEHEWKEHNTSWPTLYRPLRFEEYKKQQLVLSKVELNRMKELMDKCILIRSVLIVDPNNYSSKNQAMNESGKNEKAIDDDAISSSRNEQSSQDKLSQKQQQQNKGSSTSLLGNNPLATPILLALQGVSRREREAKMKFTEAAAADAPSAKPKSNKRERNQQQPQQRGQYICTGYDMYSFYEPSVFEAMACLHSRLRRLVYFVPDSPSSHCSSGNGSLNGESRISNSCIDDVVWGNGISKHDIHNLSGANHNYRAFEFRESSYRQ